MPEHAPSGVRGVGLCAALAPARSTFMASVILSLTFAVRDHHSIGEIS